MLTLLPALLAPLVTTQASPAELARLLPPGHNAVVVLDAASIRAAASGDAPQLREVPGWVDRYVAGIDLLLAGPVEQSRAAVVALPPGESLRDLGLIPPGFARIGGLPASTDDRGATLLELAPGLAGVLRPSDETRAASWAESMTRSRLGSGALFLQRAVSANAGLVLAVDLENAFDAEALKTFIDAHDTLRDRGLDSAAVAMTGLSFSMRAADIAAVGPGASAPATLQVGFANSPSAKPEAVRDLIAAILRELHAAMPELEAGEARIDGGDIVITMRLDSDGLERVASLAMPSGYRPLQPSSSPQVAGQAPPATASPNTAPSKPTIELPTDLGGGTQSERAEATRDYFTEMVDILDRFETAADASKAVQRNAAWIGRFAKSIARLDETNVDRRVLAYSRQAEDVMDQLAASLRGQKLAVQTAEKQLVYRYDVEPVYAPYRYNVFGGFGGVAINYPIRGPVAGFGYRGVGIGAGPIGPGGLPQVPGALPIGPGVGVLPPVTQVGTRRRVLDSNVKQIRREQAEAIKKGAAERLEAWTQLRTQENDLRAALRETYGGNWSPAE